MAKSVIYSSTELQWMEYAQKEDMMLNRRRFIRNGCTAILAPSVIKALSPIAAIGLAGCAQQEIATPPPSAKAALEAVAIYPPLKGKKIQPPENGCYIGFYNEGSKPTLEDNERRIKFKATFGKPSKFYIAPLHTQDRAEFPLQYAKVIDSLGSVPYIYSGMKFYIKELGGFSNLSNNAEFGKVITKYAKDLKDYGKPILFTTMRELNGPWFPWGNRPDTAIKNWRFMHKVFEDNGANEYATWVWELYCPHVPTVDSPNRYYPGDEYVDWIGLSAYNRSGIHLSRGSFEGIVGSTYHSMRQSHKDKPIMMAEFGHTNDHGQFPWLKEAFRTIKSWPGMKAAIFWNNINRELPDDHTLGDEGINVYKEIAKDPYFIWGSK